MSLKRCIPGMLKRGEIDPVRAKRMEELFDELEAFYSRSMGPDAAAAEASEATLKHLAAEARLKKRQTLLQIARRSDALKELDRFTGKSRYAAVSALLDDDDRAPYRGGNVTFNAQRIEFGMHGRIADFIERHRRNWRGQPNDAAGLDDVVRELHGQATANARAKGFADALSDTFEQLRQRFNQAGGNIGKIEGYGLPHRHDALKVRAAGLDRWLADITPLLDRERMIDERTGVPFTDDALRETLTGVWETIRTNGLTGEASAAFRGPGKLANRRAEHRFLHFRDGDSWLHYDRAYGSGDNPFTAIMGHVSGMSRDIAMMERLGPNPDATMKYLLDHVDRREAQSAKKVVGAVQGRARGRAITENLWRYVKGESTVPVLPENEVGYHVVRTVQGTRNILTAAMLGSAPISAISDINTGAMARGFYGLPEMKVLSGYLKQLNPLSATDRKLAARLGLGMQDAAHSLGSIARYYGETSGPGWTQVLADSVLRASGLNRLTEAGQHAMGLDLLGALGDNRHLEWKALPDKLRTAMERNGIDFHDWAAIRTAAPIRSGGAEFVDPAAILDPKASDRLMNMVLRARAMAVIETSATSRAAVAIGTNPGTFWGEILRNSLQFKGFTAGLMFKQARILSALGPYRAAIYGARFFIGMTLFGAAAIQLREIAKGNDPRPMDDHEFWADAAFQGGGLGIFGDVIGSFQNDRLSGGIASLTAGPIGSFLNDLYRAGATAFPGKKRKDGTRRPANPGGAATRLAQRYTPGSNLWYLRAAWERMVIDQLNAEIDPTHHESVKRQERRARDNRQGMWWEPDTMFPGRAPELGNALRTGQSAPGG